MPDSSDTPDYCTALTRHGMPCLRDGLPDAPFPLCVEHAAEILCWLNARTERHTDAVIAAARAVEAEDTCRPTVTQLSGRGRSVVYYLRVGRHIKIGHTSNLAQRLRFYPPDTELLAVESGDRELESQRLQQFRETLSAGEEWFAPSVALLQHIKMLAAA